MPFTRIEEFLQSPCFFDFHSLSQLCRTFFVSLSIGLTPRPSLPVERPLQPGDIELLHFHQRVHGACSAFAVSGSGPPEVMAVTCQGGGPSNRTR